MRSTISDHRLRSRILWLLGRRIRVRVSGDSMAPLLRDGDEVFVDPRAYRRAPPEPGDVVLSAHPHRTDIQILKTVRDRPSADTVFLIGADGAASTDSRSFGPVPRRNLRGRVVSR
jgi:nickel-type superoxide dismutase maturation protease